MDDYHQWNRRYQTALALPEPHDCAVTRLRKYEALTALQRDFVAAATTAATTLITELFLPPHRKSVQPRAVGGVAGGRKLELHGILFKVEALTQGTLPSLSFSLFLPLSLDHTHTHACTHALLRLPSREARPRARGIDGRARRRPNRGRAARHPHTRRLVVSLSSGWMAVLGGWRYSSGSYGYLGSGGYYWSRTENDAGKAWLYDFNYGKLDRSSSLKSIGQSCRCLKD